ncbi:FAD synthase [Candidatus Woesearchaeota archaeon]|nr:FAD synthase [Candidatus Woesearchaeota archaeon]
MKTVMCFGTFDLLHLGHLSYFTQAKKYGDHLIVVISRDYTRNKEKRKTIFNEKERVKLIQSLKIVDEAVLGYPQDHLRIIEEQKPDIIVLGYDHPIAEKELQQRLAQRNLHPAIKRAKAYKTHSQKTGTIKQKILKLK